MRIKLFEGYSPETEGKWYHGDREKMEKFSDRHMDAEDYSRNSNAWGPGVYFSNMEWQAKGYAQEAGSGYLYTCEIDVDPKRLLHDDTKVNRAKIRKFLEMVPDEENFYNFDENIQRGKMKALDAYCECETLHTAFTMAYSDLFQRDSKLFGKAMVSVGYDAIIHQVNPEHASEVFHLIVWDTTKIKILNTEKID